MAQEVVPPTQSSTDLDSLLAQLGKRALKQKDPQAVFRFWGGDRMAALAGTPVKHIRELAFMGFIEVISHLPAVLGNIVKFGDEVLMVTHDLTIVNKHRKRTVVLEHGHIVADLQEGGYVQHDQ